MSASILLANSRSNLSAMGSATMKRFAAMQDCPLLKMRAFTAVVTAVSKFALGTMPDQYGVGLDLAGEKGRNLRGSFPHLALQGRGLHSKSDEGVAVDDIPEIHVTA